jgi:hypothetical protein
MVKNIILTIGQIPGTNKSMAPCWISPIAGKRRFRRKIVIGRMGK